MTGFEPATSSLATRHSTAELHTQFLSAKSRKYGRRESRTPKAFTLNDFQDRFRRQSDCPSKTTIVKRRGQRFLSEAKNGTSRIRTED